MNRNSFLVLDAVVHLVRKPQNHGFPASSFQSFLHCANDIFTRAGFEALCCLQELKKLLCVDALSKDGSMSFLDHVQ